jgi:dihydroxyacid dehydratase/phosphogluconate dehydratase
MNKLNLDCPKLIRFHELTEDEVFCTEETAKAGVTFENTSEVEPLVVLRYFGPEVNPGAPEMGLYRKNKF